MRWRALFDDLEAQLAETDAADLRAEVADRTRREAGLLRVADRLRPAEGQVLSLSLGVSGMLQGRLLDAGPDWLLVEQDGAREVLVRLGAVLGITGLGPVADSPGSEGEVGRRLDLRWALRALARSRAGVTVLLSDGSAVTGTLDRIGADHVDLAEHPAGEARRVGSVRQVRLIPLTAITLVRSD